MWIWTHLLGTGDTWVSEPELRREEQRKGLVRIESRWLMSWSEAEWDPAKRGVDQKAGLRGSLQIHSHA